MNELPFLKERKKLPKWTKGKKWLLKRNGDATTLGFKNDLSFVVKREPNLLLHPSISMGTDGFTYIDQTHYLSVGMKFYTRNVEAAVSDRNLETTKFKNFF